VRVTLGAIRRMAVAPPSRWLRTPAVRVLRRPRPYWQERGWMRDGGEYRGAYQTPVGAFKGRAEDLGFGRLRFFITGAPAAVLEGSHSACFVSRPGGEHAVHMGVHPEDISSGIMAVERLLVETLAGRGRP
jgi:hypothetical protein